MRKIGRRALLAGSLGLGTAALGLPLAESPRPARKKLKVVFAGGHPDDPEQYAGGTMARYSDLGHEVVALYLTRGEAGIPGKNHADAGAQRSAEAEAACRVLKASPRFVGQVDADVRVDPARYDEFRAILDHEKPDVVFTHWPIDRHPDHAATSLLVYDAWLRSSKRFVLFYFYGFRADQFFPTHYVDIGATEARKREACRCHYYHRDRPELKVWDQADVIQRFRGLEAGCEFAEGFVRHAMSRGEDGI